MSATGGKMASLKKYRGRWSVKIRRKGHRGIYETFDKISDARSFINKVESDIVQQKYKDISEAANTTLRTVLHRYIREKLRIVSSCLVLLFCNNHFTRCLRKWLKDSLA